MRRSKRELEHAINNLVAGINGVSDRPGVSDNKRLAVQAAFKHRYDNYDTAAGNPNGDESEQRAFLQNTAKHVEEPHATTLQRMLSDKEKRNA